MPTPVLRPLRVLAAAALLAAGACAGAARTGPLVHRFPRETASSSWGAVASSSQEATAAGVEVLRDGGNAVDAAVAVALALGAADPGDSGLGGSTYLLVRMADGRSAAIDGSALVPLSFDRAAVRELVARDHRAGAPLAATPGSLAALEHARRRFGTRRLSELAAPAIAIAEEGFRVSPFHQIAIAYYLDDVRAADPLRRLVLTEDLEVPALGTRLRNPALASTLRRIAAEGADSFYRGAIAAEIERDLRRVGGSVTRADLGFLRVPELPPLRGSYRGTEVLSFPPPGGGAAVVEALHILQSFPPELLDTDSAERLRVLGETFRLALADHRRHMASYDPVLAATTAPPHVDPAFAAGRADLIRSSGRALTAPADGAAEEADAWGNTVQVSVADRHGNVVALTQTLGPFFGNKVVTPTLGFPYNGALAGLHPDNVDRLRPRSPLPTDMAPTIVVREGRPVLALGSASSSRIPAAVALVISHVLDRDMGIADAVAAPRVLWSEGENTIGLMLEVEPPIRRRHVRALARRGYDPILTVAFPCRLEDFGKYGAVNAVLYDAATGEWTAAADPRRTGAAQAVEVAP